MWMSMQMMFLLSVGSLCQQITLDALEQISPCSSGLRSSTDMCLINGTVAGNIAGYWALGWEKIIYTQVLTTSSGFKTICAISLTTTSGHPNSAAPCYCHDISQATGKLHFTIRLKADVQLSGGIIRVQWKRAYNSSVVLYSNNQTLPQMYDAKAAELSLTVSNATGNLTTSGACNFSLTLNKTNQLTLCCSKTATPCYPRIYFKGEVVTNMSCVKYPACQLALERVRGDLVLSYSLCSEADYIQGSSCAVKVESTRTPSSSFGIIFMVIFPTVIVGCVTACVVNAILKKGKVAAYHRRNANNPPSDESESLH